MKDIVSKVKSFVTFELPVQPAYIRASFATLHERFKKDDPDWSLSATRQKLIGLYWFKLVPLHFATLMILASILISFTKAPQVTSESAVTFFTVGLATYISLWLFHYKPIFLSTYLPNLENAREIYEGRENENLEKCRQAQLSNFSLALLFYTFSQMNKISLFRNDDRIAGLLTKLYGVDSGSLKKNIDILICPSAYKFSERKLTELRNRFTETYDFLEVIKYSAAIDCLKQIERQVFTMK